MLKVGWMEVEIQDFLFSSQERELASFGTEKITEREKLTLYVVLHVYR